MLIQKSMKMITIISMRIVRIMTVMMIVTSYLDNDTNSNDDDNTNDKYQHDSTNQK